MILFKINKRIFLIKHKNYIYIYFVSSLSDGYILPIFIEAIINNEYNGNKTFFNNKYFCKRKSIKIGN